MTPRSVLAAAAVLALLGTGAGCEGEGSEASVPAAASSAQRWKPLAPATLRHRIRLRPEAELDGVTADGVVESVLAGVPAPR